MRKIAFFALLALWPALCLAGGEVRVDGMGPQALGRGGVGNAFPQQERIEGSSIYYNVAGFALVPSAICQTGFDLVAPNFRYEKPSGADLNSEDQLFFLPQIIFAGKADKSDLAFFSGIYSPFGLGATNPESWRSGLGFRKSQIGLINVTWGLAGQIDPDWSVGAGIDLGYGRLLYGTSLHQLGRKPFTPVYLESQADGFGLSGRLGALWQPSDNFAWGLSLSLPMRIDFEGHTDMSLYGLSLGRDRNATSYTFPGRLGTGIKLALTGRLALGADVNWYFGRSEEMKMNFRILPTVRQNMDWQNNFSAHLGGEYQLSDRAILRAGFAYLTNAVPENTQNPVIPDYKNGYGAGIGLGWQLTKPPENPQAKAKPVWNLDLAYNYSWAATRHVSRSWKNLAPGDYDFSGHVLSAGLTCRF